MMWALLLSGLLGRAWAGEEGANSEVGAELWVPFLHEGAYIAMAGGKVVGIGQAIGTDLNAQSTVGVTCEESWILGGSIFAASVDPSKLSGPFATLAIDKLPKFPNRLPWTTKSAPDYGDTAPLTFLLIGTALDSTHDFLAQRVAFNEDRVRYVTATCVVTNGQTPPSGDDPEFPPNATNRHWSEVAGGSTPTAFVYAEAPKTGPGSASRSTRTWELAQGGTFLSALSTVTKMGFAGNTEPATLKDWYDASRTALSGDLKLLSADVLGYDHLAEVPP